MVFESQTKLISLIPQGQRGTSIFLTLNPGRAYFSGCSDGGREALMEAQRFPQDYDGIVAGAPVSNWTKLQTNRVWFEQALDQPSSWLSPEKLSIVTKAVLATCDGEAGYLGDPAECRFDPSSLVCKGGQSEGCLSEPEVAALKKIYSGAEDANGKSIFPGYAPGGESGPGAWPLWITGTEPKRTAGTLAYAFATGYFADMVFDKPDWRIDGQKVGDDLAAADKATAEALDATDPDLTAFKAAGGKLIQYHGWNDASIPPQASIDYYQSVANEMGGPAEPPVLLPAVHGARHGALRWRTGPQRRRRRLRPAFAEPRSRPRRRRGACPLGRTRRGARFYHRDALSRQRPGQGHRSAASVVSVSGRRPLHG
jgi:feruloyl esterase